METLKEALIAESTRIPERKNVNDVCIARFPDGCNLTKDQFVKGSQEYWNLRTGDSFIPGDPENDAIKLKMQADNQAFLDVIGIINTREIYGYSLLPWTDILPGKPWEKVIAWQPTGRDA